MLKHFFTAALRNLAANRLLSAISIFGLAVGLTGVMVMALVIRNQMTFDHFIPNYGRTYLAISVLAPAGLPPNYNAKTNDRVAALLKVNLSGVSAVARLMEKYADLRQDGVSATEKIYWADPNTFEVLSLPVLYGKLDTALLRPDSVVLNEGMARKYFGRDDAVGRTLEVNGHPMMVTAVIADLPVNATDLETGIFAAGVAADSSLGALGTALPRGFAIDVRTYVQLAPGADIAQVESRIPGLLRGLLPPPMRAFYSMPLVPIDQLALFDGFNPGIRERLLVGGLVGLLILFIAIVNFINLTLARSARREKEVGVRKTSGASRLQLMAQFLSESTLTILLAALLAIAMSEWLLPAVNAFLETGAAFDYWRYPGLIVWLVAGVAGLGVLAGFYPAIVLSALRPSLILRGIAQTEDAGLVRSGLVVMQFAVLIGLLIATGVVYQQRLYATGPALRVRTGNILIVQAKCPPAFREEVRNLSGVEGAACSGGEFLTGSMFAPIEINGKPIGTDFVSTEYAAFALYRLKPIAGLLPDFNSDTTRVVINQTAARRFGFASPFAAIGHTVPLPAQGRNAPRTTGTIAAVIPDFALYSVETAIKPTIYLNQLAAPSGQGIVQIALSDRDQAATLAMIDRLWKLTGNQGAIDQAFLDDHIRELYLDLRRDAQLFGLFSGLAVFLACLGLVGIAISTAERRTKEIGIRKAMGATSAEIVALLLWQFSKPVLLANLIAWPLTWWLMSDWLNNFAYHVPLRVWLFPAAGGIALLVAVITVASQAVLVARQEPVLALRYE